MQISWFIHPALSFPCSISCRQIIRLRQALCVHLRCQIFRFLWKILIIALMKNEFTEIMLLSKLMAFSFQNSLEPLSNFSILLQNLYSSFRTARSVDWIVAWIECALWYFLPSYFTVRLVVLVHLDPSHLCAQIDCMILLKSVAIQQPYNTKHIFRWEVLYTFFCIWFHFVPFLSYFTF